MSKAAPITCGLPAALLFICILIRATRTRWRAFYRASPASTEAKLWRVVAALMPVLILNSILGNTFTFYSVAPIGWLLLGWISSRELRDVEVGDSIEEA